MSHDLPRLLLPPNSSMPSCSSPSTMGLADWDGIRHEVVGIFRFALSLPSETGCLSVRSFQFLRQPGTALLSW